MFVASYAGARPLGRALPPLATAPQASPCGSVPLHLIFAFARDAAHDGVFTFYDTWQLETAARQLCGAQRGMLSLAGAGFAWGLAPGVTLDAWVANALASLQDLLHRYGLCGLDINYEEGLEAGGFPQAMAALVVGLKGWRPSLLVTVAPFDAVWPHYRALLQLAGSSIDYINWQVYAELEHPGATSDQVVRAYDRLAAELGGYGRLTLGVNTEPEQLRGPQLAACLAAFRALKAKGLGGAFTWALDNSCACGYQTERALLAIAAEPVDSATAGGATLGQPGLLPHPHWHPVPQQHAQQGQQAAPGWVPPRQQGDDRPPPGSFQLCCSTM